MTIRLDKRQRSCMTQCARAAQSQYLYTGRSIFIRINLALTKGERHPDEPKERERERVS